MSFALPKVISQDLGVYLLIVALLGVAFAGWRIGDATAADCQDAFLEFGSYALILLTVCLGLAGYFAITVRLRWTVARVVLRIVGVVCAYLFLQLVWALAGSRSGSCSDIGDRGYVHVAPILNWLAYGSAAAYVGAIVTRFVTSRST
jgi:hypothetical protein